VLSDIVCITPSIDERGEFSQKGRKEIISKNAQGKSYKIIFKVSANTFTTATNFIRKWKIHGITARAPELAAKGKLTLEL